VVLGGRSDDGVTDDGQRKEAEHDGSTDLIPIGNKRSDDCKGPKIWPLVSSTGSELEKNVPVRKAATAYGGTEKSWAEMAV
jgi:hypothetical protein